MGIPVSPKNIFPSNIQGLPTWYEVRVSEAGYTARRDGIDMMVAMNPQTYANDVAELVSGGWLLYDSTMPRLWQRTDITVLGLPIAEICAKIWKDARQRQLFKNMVYVGALTALLDMDVKVLEGVFEENPGYPHAAQTLGVIYFDQGQFERATSVYIAALQHLPNSEELHNNLGNAALQRLAALSPEAAQAMKRRRYEWD
jgi:tetratricopeptide (TPR) repeat protein